MSSAPARPWLGLAGWLGVTFVAAAIGSVASMDAGEFYAQLDRPAWAPPSSLFGPVWSALYALMGLAAWLVWRTRGWEGARPALTLYLVQLVLNALWSWLFFRWRIGAAAFGEVLLLLLFIVLTIVAFARVHRTAAAMLLPYLAWVSYASALTWSVWRANPSLL